VGLLVLDPTSGTALASDGYEPFHDGGTSGNVTILGGPLFSIQVNSLSQNNAAGSTGNVTIDLSHANLRTDGTCPGGDFGTSGGPNAQPFGINFSGKWVPHDSQILDPFASFTLPTAYLPPSLGGTLAAAPLPQAVSYGWQLDHTGASTFVYCPDSKNLCTRFSAGYYAPGSPALAAINEIKATTAIFDPGFYYIDCSGSGSSSCTYPGMNLDSNSVVRPSGASYDLNGNPIPAIWTTGSAGGAYVGGTTFYFAGVGSINLQGNSGGPYATVDNFSTSSLYTPTSSSIGCGAQNQGPKCALGTVPALGVQIPCGSTSLPVCPSPSPGLPSTLDSHVFLGPCGTSNPFQLETSNTARGLTFMDAHNTKNTFAGGTTPSVQGGGSWLVVGAMYFHQCTGAKAPQTCQAPTTDYNDVLQLGGNGSESSFAFGSIVTDQLLLKGGSSIDLFLDMYFFSKTPKVFLAR
jgi:hypothetical protein